MKKYAIYVTLFTALCLAAFTQHSFEPEIRKFLQADSVSFPPPDAILFVGSSSFRMWHNLQQDFPRHTVINRGFGGSSLPDVYYYRDKIIFPYKPKQVVIYCGENDVASGVSGAEVFERFKDLFTSIRSELPRASIVFVSMKPSPSRARFRAEVEKGNALIAAYLKKQKRSTYVDVYTPMLGSDGQPRQELFLEDMLHMNEKGYAIWRDAIEPVLAR